ncbi:hypothetical protein PMAYCL1PPCAC_01557, partial [Pristionchus mayeri]
VKDAEKTIQTPKKINEEYVGENWADRLVNMKQEEDQIVIRDLSPSPESSPVMESKEVEGVPSFEFDTSYEIDEESVDDTEDWDDGLIDIKEEEETVYTANRPDSRGSFSHCLLDFTHIRDFRLEFPKFPVIDFNEEIQDDLPLSVEKKGGMRRSDRVKQRAMNRSFDDANRTKVLLRK